MESMEAADEAGELVTHDLSLTLVALSNVTGGDRSLMDRQDVFVNPRTVLIKRKLEELEGAAKDSSGFTISQVRPRRESREEMQDDLYDASLRILSDCVQLKVAEEVDRATVQPVTSLQLRAVEDLDCVHAHPIMHSQLTAIEDGIGIPGQSPFNAQLKALEEGDRISINAAGVASKLELREKDDIDQMSFDALDHTDSGLTQESIKTRCPEEDHCQHLEALGSKCMPLECSDWDESSVGTTKLNGESCMSSCCRVVEAAHESFSYPMVQFFVRTFIDGRTIVLHAYAEDTIESIHQQIFLRTGLPVSEQRLIYFGRQLQQNQTLAECHVCNDATLHLVARMLSTPLHRSWQVVSDLVATLHHVSSMDVGARHSFVRLEQLQDKIRILVREFLSMAADSLPVSDHMQVFQLAGAASALVNQLLSPEETNQYCAEESIRLFLTASDDLLPADTHFYCAPVLLDFCKLLTKSAPSHPFYNTCRNALALILDTIGVAHLSTYFNNAKAEIIVHDFAPFLDELASELALSLRSMAKAECNSPLIPYLGAREGHDFAAFATPFCKALGACRGLEVVSSPHASSFSSSASFRCWEDANNRVLGALCRKDFTGDDVEGMLDEVDKKGGEVGSHNWLYTIFQGLLFEIDGCLERVEGELQASRDLPFLAPVLVVLKGLHTIAELYAGCMETLLTILSSRCKALNGLIQQSGWQNDHFWLLDHKFLLEFESTKRVVLGMLPEPQDDFEERHEIVIHRDRLLSESLRKFEDARLDTLQAGLSVEFAMEEATGPGVLREWFSLICREIFNSGNALFLSCPVDGRRFYPNPGVSLEELNSFRFCGRVVALALMHKIQIDVVFTLIFYKLVAGIPITWEDVKDADPVLYDSCKKILEMDADVVDSDALGLTFVHEFEELGTMKSVELCTGGRDMPVTSRNRLLYVGLLVQCRFVSSIEKQTESFCQGFSDLLVSGSIQQFMQALEPHEFELILYGKDRDICLDDWKAHTEYHEYCSSDCQIIWFWQVVSSMTTDQRRRLLFFSTSVNHLPSEGFVGLPSKFHIRKAHTDVSWLPTAHTCFYQLVLPPYPSYDVMHEKLYAVIEEHVSEGFGFS